MKVLPLLGLLCSGVALAQETQEEKEEKGEWYWAAKPVSCTGGDKVIELMQEHNENPTIWMEGLVGNPNGTLTESKFVIAVNPESNPPTWTLIEFTNGGVQGCILGHGEGSINIGQVKMQRGVGT
tara:strand:+ start:3136 stop:3510 length:375 start_codon:yes stop_codon:yes gene_type:complete